MIPQGPSRAGCSTYLCELSNNTIAFGANQFLDRGVVEDGVWRCADLHPAAAVGQHLQPSVSREVLCDHHSLRAPFVVNLWGKTLAVAAWCGGVEVHSASVGAHPPAIVVWDVPPLFPEANWNNGGEPMLAK